MLILNAKMEKLFFDAKKIDDHLDATAKKVHMRAGSMVMRDASDSMKSVSVKAKKQAPPSPPGKPPRARRKLLKRSNKYGLKFAYDLATKSVIVGALNYPRGSQRTDSTGARTLEKSGRIKYRMGQDKGGKWSIKGYRAAKKAGRPTKTGVARLEARPYVGPAGEKNAGKLPQLWRNAV